MDQTSSGSSIDFRCLASASGSTTLWSQNLKSNQFTTIRSDVIAKTDTSKNIKHKNNLDSVNRRPPDGHAGIKKLCNKENLPKSNVQPALTSTCDNLTKPLSNNPITNMLGDECRQEELLKDTDVAQTQSEEIKASQPELMGDQNLVASVTQADSNTGSNDCPSSNLSSHVTSTPIDSIPFELNMSPIISSSTARHASDVEGTTVINAASNATEPNLEDSIMGFIDVLVASDEDEIRQEVEERVERMVENQRTACDSLWSSINISSTIAETELDSSVEFVPNTLHPTINLTDTIDNIVLSSNDSDIEIYEQPCTSRTGRLNRRKRGAVINQRPNKKVKYTTSTSSVQILPNISSQEIVTATPPAPQNFAPSSYDCPICLNELKSNQISATICGHVFCTPCITAAIKSLKNCPNCRTKLTLKKIHPLFL